MNIDIFWYNCLALILQTHSILSPISPIRKLNFLFLLDVSFKFMQWERGGELENCEYVNAVKG